MQPLPGLEGLLQSDAEAGKVQWLAVCMMGLSLTGCGDAFAKLKACTSHHMDTHKRLTISFMHYWW